MQKRIPQLPVIRKSNSALFKKTRGGTISFSSENLNNLEAEGVSIALEANARIKANAVRAANGKLSHSNYSANSISQSAMWPEPVSVATSRPEPEPEPEDGWELSRLEHDNTSGQAALFRGEVDKIKLDYFFFGLTSGASLQMFLVSFFLMYISSGVNVGPLNELSKEYYPVFRMIFFVIWFFSLYGCVLFVLKRYQVDYFSVLNLPRDHTYSFVIRGAASSAYIVFTCFALYVLTISELMDHVLLVSKHVWPLLAIVLPVVLFFCPSDSLTHGCYGVKAYGFSQRLNMVKQVGAVLCSPFSEPTRIRCLMADVMCSMPKIFSDMLYTVFIYATWQPSASIQQVPQTAFFHEVGIYLAILPYSLRVLQTLRSVWDEPSSLHCHYFNLLKYCLSVSVTLLNVAQKNADEDEVQFWRLSWQCVAAVATIMSYYSDVVNGWGLFEKGSSNLFLREQLTFPVPAYYAGMVSNLLFRVCWAFNISPGQPYIAQNFLLLVGCMELLRRNIWLVFRVENLALKLNDKKGEVMNDDSYSSINVAYENNDEAKSKSNRATYTYGSMELTTTGISSMESKKNLPYLCSFDEMQHICPTLRCGTLGLESDHN